MNNNFYESSYLHYLAGVINEDQYHEILGFNLLSRPDTDKGILGLYDINFDNNLMHIDPVRSRDGLSPEQSRLAGRSRIKTTLELTDDQLDDFVDSFGDDIAKHKLKVYKKHSVKFDHTIRDAKLKLIGNELHIDALNIHSGCFDFACFIELSPDQVSQIRR